MDIKSLYQYVRNMDKVGRLWSVILVNGEHKEISKKADIKCSNCEVELFVWRMGRYCYECGKALRIWQD